MADTGSPRPTERSSRRSGGRPASLGVANYMDDPLYPRVCRAVAALLERSKVVAPVDVLVGMGLLAPRDLENWRRGRVPYLERVIHCNLARLSRLLRVLRFHVHDLNLEPSWTAYMRWGKGPKQRLVFTKHRDPKLEEACAMHFVWPGKGPFHPPAAKAAAVKRDSWDRAEREPESVRNAPPTSALV